MFRTTINVCSLFCVILALGIWIQGQTVWYHWFKPNRSTTITVEPKTGINIGRVQAHDTATANFSIKNTGNETLIIERIEVDCSCTTYHVTTYETQPKGIIQLTVEYDKRLKGHFKNFVEVYGNFKSRLLAFETSTDQLQLFEL